MEQTNTKRNNKPVIIAAVVLVTLLAAVGILLATRTQAQPVVGEKTIQVSIYHGEALQRELEIQTDAEFLRGALEEQGLIAGDESEFGMFVKAVDGVTADESKQEWWGFTKGGEMLFTGVDDTPVQDGDAFEITLMTGWS